MQYRPMFIIPARGGSKGVPRKNVAEVGHIALVGRAVRTARHTAALLGGGDVVVDSDDSEILALAAEWGADTCRLRPADLATDTATSIAVLQAAITALDVDDERPVVLLQATTAFTTPEHVVECLRAWEGNRNGAAVSVVRSSTHPDQLFYRDGEDSIASMSPFSAVSVARRQEIPDLWRLTGGVYVARAGHLRSGVHFVNLVPLLGVEAPWKMSIDIDEPADLALSVALAPEPTLVIGIGGRPIGGGHPAYIIAEAGVNHDGDPERAHRLIDLAKDAGADAVKFQTWITEAICRPDADQAEYQIANSGIRQSQFEMLKRLELPRECYPELVAHCEEIGIEFLSTPDEIDSARFLVDLGVAAIKIGSAEVENTPYLRELAGFGLPVLLSTGMADLVQVDRAVDALRGGGADQIALFHTVSAYPANVASMNVRAIATLRDVFGVPAGLSDHCSDVEPVVAAVGVGLDIWEKHLTDDRTRPGPDHTASLDPRQFAAQVAAVRRAEQSLGSGTKRMMDDETDTFRAVQRRLYLVRAVAAGENIDWSMLEALRGGDGMAIGSLDRVVGRRLVCDAAAGAPLTDEMVEWS